MKTKAIQVGSITFVHKTWDGELRDDVQASYAGDSSYSSSSPETEVDISQEDAARIIDLLLAAYPQIRSGL